MKSQLSKIVLLLAVLIGMVFLILVIRGKQNPCLEPSIKVHKNDDLFKSDEILIKEVAEDDIRSDEEGFYEGDKDFSFLPINDLVLREKNSGKYYLNSKYIKHFQQTRNAFAGKVNKEHVNRENFKEILNILLVTGVFNTYYHIEADFCPIYVDRLNPEPSGMLIDYKIKHLYCSNKCQWAEYKMRVELNNDSEFIAFALSR